MSDRVDSAWAEGYVIRRADGEFHSGEGWALTGADILRGQDLATENG